MRTNAKGKGAVACASGLQRRSRTFSYRESRVLLAAASFDGKIRFLNCAWESVLGANAEPRCTRSLREILPPDPETADIVASALLDRRCRMPIEIGILDASGKICRFLWHRRYDPNDQLMYLAGEEVPARAPGAERGAGPDGEEAAA